MVGGRVVGIVRYEGQDHTMLHVREKGGGSSCCVRVVEGEEVVGLHDTVWWQGSRLFWSTPTRKDRQLRKLGYTFDAPQGHDA